MSRPISPPTRARPPQRSARPLWRLAREKRENPRVSRGEPAPRRRPTRSAPHRTLALPAPTGGGRCVRRRGLASPALLGGVGRCVRCRGLASPGSRTHPRAPTRGPTRTRLARLARGVPTRAGGRARLARLACAGARRGGRSPLASPGSLSARDACAARGCVHTRLARVDSGVCPDAGVHSPPSRPTCEWCLNLEARHCGRGGDSDRPTCNEGSSVHAGHHAEALTAPKRHSARIIRQFYRAHDHAGTISPDYLDLQSVSDKVCLDGDWSVPSPWTHTSHGLSPLAERCIGGKHTARLSVSRRRLSGGKSIVTLSVGNLTSAAARDLTSVL